MEGRTPQDIVDAVLREVLGWGDLRYVTVYRYSGENPPLHEVEVVVEPLDEGEYLPPQATTAVLELRCYEPRPGRPTTWLTLRYWPRYRTSTEVARRLYQFLRRHLGNRLWLESLTLRYEHEQNI